MNHSKMNPVHMIILIYSFGSNKGEVEALFVTVYGGGESVLSSPSLLFLHAFFRLSRV